MIRNPIKKWSRLGVVVLACMGLAGCYDIETTLSFKQDGTSSVSSRFDFPRDAKHVADFYKAIMGLSPETKPFFDQGLCQSVEKMASANPQFSVPLRAHEYTTEARFGCGFLYDAGDSASMVDRLAALPAGPANVLSVEKLGPRQVRVELDFNKMPDLSQMLPGFIMLGAMQYGKPGQPLPDAAALAEVSKSYVEASLAIARMSAADNHLQFAIKARRVVDTNGEQDGNLVRFRWSWEEFTKLLLKPADGDPVSKVYYAVIEY